MCWESCDFSNRFLYARYVDGERLTPEDEKAVVEKLLAYHPRAEDKIGCGLDAIMVKMQCTRALCFCQIFAIDLVALLIVVYHCDFVEASQTNFQSS